MGLFSEKKYIALFGASLTVVSAIALGSASVAWFMSATEINSDSLSGSVLKNYFHTGTGVDAEHPFVITRPIHYENMIKLHYDMRGFADKNFYFSFGYDLDGDGDKEFYKYDENTGAIVNGEYSDVLVCSGLEDLPPLGTPDKPFNAHIDGNGLTISNFSISAGAYSSTSFCDIGIFGYIENGTVTNAYFSDYCIDASSAQTTGSSHSSGEGDHTNTANVGYLAGHVVDPANLTNVYVNNCEMKSAESTTIQQDNYGYYGFVEKDILGGKYGNGSSYSFSLNSQAVYNYFDNNYDSIKDNPLVLRNTKETESGSITNPQTGDKEKIISGAKFDDAVKHPGNTLDRYSLERDDSNINHSLSTVGYVDKHYEDTTFEYYTYYKNGSNYYNLPRRTETTTIPLSECMDGAGLQDDNEDGVDRLYYDESNADNAHWVYYHAENRPSVKTDYVSITISFNLPSWSLTSVRSMTNGSSNTHVSYLYWDDQAIPLSLSFSFTNAFLSTSRKITATATAEVVDSGNSIYGYHNVAAIFNLSFKNDNGNTRHASYYYGSLDSNTNTLSQVTELFTKQNETRTLDCQYIRPDSMTSTDITQVSISSYSAPEWKATAFTVGSSYQFDVYVIDKNRYGPTSYSNAVLLETKRASFVYYSPYMMCTAIVPVLISDADYNNFSADQTEIKSSGYEYKNIDLVGGSEPIEFFSKYGIKIILLPSESSSSPTMPAITQSQAINKTKFYANDFCPSSVVLFIRNTVNRPEATMGTIDFTYVSLWGLTSYQPSFKKGGGSFVPLENYGSAGSGLTSTISLTLTKQQVQEVSYCALDKDGNIIGNFGTNGQPNVGFGTGGNSTGDIYTYVVVLGGSSSSGRDAWVTNIDFSYVAETGYGGYFGTVEYRSAPDVLGSDEGTILTMYFIVDNTESRKWAYYSKVIYDNSTRTYTVTFGASLALQVNVFNYDPDNYTVVFNGVTMSSGTSSQTFTVGAGTYTYS